MKARCSRWAVRATLTVAAFALSACAGNNLSPTPNVEGFNQAASAGAEIGARPGLMTLNAQPNVKCPTKYLDCDTVSKKNGLVLNWCIGPSTNPCSKSSAGNYTWSGVVCDAKGKTCKKPIKQLTAAWTGPFKCKKKDKCKGTYEVDTITPGPGLKVTTKYAYKQDVHVCASSGCQDVYIGLNVGK